MRYQLLQLSKAQLNALATLSAQMAFDHDAEGNAFPIKDPRAVGALKRGFTQLYRRGGKSFAMQVSTGEALGFPSQRKHGENMLYALALGMDEAGRGSFAVQGVAAVFKNANATPVRIKRKAEAEAYRLASEAALSRLNMACAASGQLGRRHE